MTRIAPAHAGRRYRAAQPVLLLVFAVAASACTPVPQPVPSASPVPSMVREETGINGHVVDEAGAPLADVLVTIESGNFVGEAHTTGDGTFSTRGVVGNFRIQAFELGFATASQIISVAPNQIVEVTLVMVATE